MIVDKSTKHNL